MEGFEMFDPNTPIYNELKWDFEFFRGECEHGLSKWLCEGPMHYPADSPWDDEPPF